MIRKDIFTEYTKRPKTFERILNNARQAKCIRTPEHRATVEEIKNFPEMPDEIFNVFYSDINAAGLTPGVVMNILIRNGYHVEIREFRAKSKTLCWLHAVMIVNAPTD